MYVECSFDKHDGAPSCSQKHLVGLLLDEGLNFNKDIQSKMNTCHKVVGVIKKLSSDLPRGVLLRIYKSFIRPIMDYGDIIYDNFNKNHPKVGVFNTKHV